MNIKKTLEALEKNNMKAFFVKEEEALSAAAAFAKKTDIIGYGGSVTLQQIGLLDYLRKEGYNILDWINNKSDKERLLHETFNADVFFTGTNAVTEDGKLYNVDGRGNRVAAMVYGPKKVVVVCGKNKIVKNLQEAIRRVETIAGPMNAKRLGRRTGCQKTGYCISCDSPERICSTIVVHEKQQNQRINVIIVDAELGF
ncbi:MAG: lactate utilization protein [Candidatus Woesearchaeota archaeon]